ncbi:MAG: hypothetical protein QXQ50_07005 [Candidatus Bathyarchaeia archaeon]
MDLLPREEWLKSLGLQFDPFYYLEASEDPHLFDYIVVREDLLWKIWNDTHSLIFAPPGGGKTALRLYFTRACWLPPARGFPFPLPYEIPRFLPWDSPPTIENHLQALLKAASSTILIMLSLRPFLWEEFTEEEKMLLVYFLNSTLPMPLSFYLAQMETARSPKPLFNSFGRTFAILNFSPRFDCFVQELRSIKSDSVPFRQNQWELFLKIIKLMGFRDAYILMDGLDFAPYNQISGEKALELLKPMIDLLPRLESQRIFLKAFLPLEHMAILVKAFSPSIDFTSHTLEWDRPLLEELIRRRIWLSSNGYIENLDALCSSSLRGLSSLLMEISPSLLPRTIIYCVSELFDIHLRRVGPQGLLDETDLDFLLNKLKQEEIYAT